jgi:hypothetical protein
MLTAPLGRGFSSNYVGCCRVHEVAEGTLEVPATTEEASVAVLAEAPQIAVRMAYGLPRQRYLEPVD